MRKLLTIILCIVCLSTLAACSQKQEQQEQQHEHTLVHHDEIAASCIEEGRVEKTITSSMSL